MIEVENLTKKYGSHTAVEKLSFRVEKGMIYGFLGPNGAGKSTTMNMMTGYLAATDGTVRINGHDILKEPEKAKQCIGYLPELPPVYPDMTTYEYLKFVAEIKKVGKAQRMEQIERIMEQTQILAVRDRLIKNLSKGYKQRIGLAQALVGDPEVIILDEPTVGLDPKQIIEMREFIRALSRNHTIILSSHILSEVRAVCDHIMIISKGRLVASDTPEGLMTLFQGSRQLVLTALGKQETLERILTEIADVESYKIEETVNENEVHAVIQFGTQTDIRKELFYRLAASDMPIMSLGLTEKSLEDVFLELTGEEKEIPHVQEESATSEDTTTSEKSEEKEETADDGDI